MVFGASTRCLGARATTLMWSRIKRAFVSEAGGDGTDTVLSWISFSLADPVHAVGAIENLTLLGPAAINAT